MNSLGYTYTENTGADEFRKLFTKSDRAPSRIAVRRVFPLHQDFGDRPQVPEQERVGHHWLESSCERKSPAVLNMVSFPTPRHPKQYSRKRTTYYPILFLDTAEQHTVLVKAVEEERQQEQCRVAQ